MLVAIKGLQQLRQPKTCEHDDEEDDRIVGVEEWPSLLIVASERKGIYYACLGDSSIIRFTHLTKNVKSYWIRLHNAQFVEGPVGISKLANGMMELCWPNVVWMAQGEE